jgi:hypothetical protein
LEPYKEKETENVDPFGIGFRIQIRNYLLAVPHMKYN